MAHDFIKDDLHLEDAQGRISYEIVATLLGGTLLLCSVIALYIFDGASLWDTEEETGSTFYSSTLAMVAAILLGAPLVWTAVKDLMRGKMFMNELIALAVIAAFAMGSYLEAAAVAFFTIIAVLIEARTAMGARASIESLIRITPTRARRIREGTEEEVEAKDLNEGDIVRVLPGDNIPADGVVVKGTSTVNQANITGESLPVDKNEGDEVFSGTINVTGAMDLRVTKAGVDTTLGRVKDLILRAEQSRIPILRMVDKYASWYTPTVLMLVIVVLFFLVKGGYEDPWERAIAMLVVACPCALILANPTAMVASLSSAARLGVLVKNVTDLEAARGITAIVFDKTGTITTGQLAVTRLNPASEDVDPTELLRAAASAEQNSRHPVARAVMEVARKARLNVGEPTHFEEVSGRGVIADVDGSRVLVGRPAWVVEAAGDQMAADTIAAINKAQESPEAEGMSLLFVVKNNQLLGWMGLEDNARAGAGNSVDQLRDLGIKRVIMVTGDRESVAKRIAGQLHMEYRAEVLPHQKLEIVDELKAAGHRVAVIGDGVNDAPALAAGDISIAMGAAGSDVAIHSASIALMNNNLNRVPFLVELSRRTIAVIRQNLLIGGVFIVVALSVTAAGWVPVVAAAVLHLLSGLVVVFNSARLVRMGEDIEHREHQQARDMNRRTQGHTAPSAPQQTGPSASGSPAPAPVV